MPRNVKRWGLAVGLLAVALLASRYASAASVPALDGRSLGTIWCLPFAGFILSIAVIPNFAPGFWQRHYSGVTLFWTLALLVPLGAAQGIAVAAVSVRDAVLLQYLPFIVLMFALFTISGGIRVTGALNGTPASNVCLLVLGLVLASVIGTAGAPVLLIRPLIRANAWRRHAAPVFVFFIFLVCNIGGALTPIGNPPLFLGFLAGVSFFWPLRHLFAPTLFVSGVLLALFFAIDSYAYRREIVPIHPVAPGKLGIEGKRNLVLLLLAIAAVTGSGLWRPGIDLSIFGAEIGVQDMLRETLLIALALISLKITHSDTHQANGFSWTPMREVAELFAGIFLTIMPAIAILRAGAAGALGPWIALLARPGGRPDDALYFWCAGLLSSALDNAPAYLMLFNAAGGDALALMGKLATTLAAISAGAQFMGALTYIGNAPNFMVKSICEERGVKMPSFLGYLAWSGAILGPVYILVTVLFW